MSSDLSGVTLLGSKVEIPNQYSPSILESFPNKFEGSDYVVELVCPEFTSLCPKTGQPDFAEIGIKYSPRERLVESKSLKLYLFSYRNHGSFHEDCVNMICQDLANLLCPKWIEIRGKFRPRGGIAINAVVRWEFKE